MSVMSDLYQIFGSLQDLMLRKEEGFGKVHELSELAQKVLANTAPAGHDPINGTVDSIQSLWSQLASKLEETKVCDFDIIPPIDSIYFTRKLQC